MKAIPIVLIALVLAGCAGGRKHPFVAVNVINIVDEHADRDRDDVVVQRPTGRTQVRQFK